MKYITDDEFNLITEKMSSNFQKIAVLMMETGLRCGEVLKLKYNNIDFENQKVWNTETKSGKDHYVILSDKAIDILKSIEPVDDKLFELNPVNVQAAFNRYAKNLNIDANLSAVRNSAIQKLSKKLSLDELIENIGRNKFGNNQDLNKYY